MELDRSDAIAGSLLAGAIGDCLGAATEFKSLNEILQVFGPAGLTEIHAPGRFTDDTQMTLFSVVGVITALLEDDKPSAQQWTASFHSAYLEWLRTQEIRMPREKPAGSWLLHEKTLYRREAPGMTCLSALRSGEAGTLDDRINTSKGCGGVMRAAPIGLLLADSHSREEIYEIGCLSAAVTHGHDGGIYPSGALAVMVVDLMNGATVAEAVKNLRGLVPKDLHERLLEAVAFAASQPLAPIALCDELGQGWVGDEALAIAVACAVGGYDLEDALLVAVNHDGDTDSTGAICGNLLGAKLGVSAIPKRFLDKAPQAPLVAQLANDCGQFLSGDRTPAFTARYGR
jgi:ADP-ribosylglycohydrolase